MGNYRLRASALTGKRNSNYVQLCESLIAFDWNVSVIGIKNWITAADLTTANDQTCQLRLKIHVMTSPANSPEPNTHSHPTAWWNFPVIYYSKAPNSIFTRNIWAQSAIKLRSLISLSHLFFMSLGKVAKEYSNNRQSIDFHEIYEWHRVEWIARKSFFHFFWFLSKGFSRSSSWFYEVLCATALRSYCCLPSIKYQMHLSDSVHPSPLSHYQSLQYFYGPKDRLLPLSHLLRASINSTFFLSPFWLHHE